MICCDWMSEKNTVPWMEVFITRGSTVCGSVCHYSCTCILPRRLSSSSYLALNHLAQRPGQLLMMWVVCRSRYYKIFTFFLNFGLSYVCISQCKWMFIAYLLQPEPLHLYLSLSARLFHLSLALSVDLPVLPSACPSVRCCVSTGLA